MSIYVLIHGGMHGAWCWQRVARLLEGAGHRVVAPDLPGHGDDSTSRPTIRLRDYVVTVQNILEAQPEPAVLVGHSMGGVIVSAAADRCPERVRHLIYLTAIVPRAGEQVREASGGEALRNDALESGLTPVEGEASHMVSAEIARATFFSDLDEHAAADAYSRLTPEPDAPFTERIELTPGRLESLKRTYILCDRDRALPMNKQLFVVSRYPNTRTLTLTSGHSPFLSQPEQLVELLARN